MPGEGKREKISFMKFLLVISPRLAYYCVKRKVITLLHKNIILSGGHGYV